MRTSLLSCVLPFVLALSAAAQTPREGDFTVRDFKFQSGEVLPELRQHYLTLGTPNRDAQGHVTNAVLLLHGTTRTGRRFLLPSFSKQLYGPGQPLDTSRYYLIMPDGIGRGGSSKPSDGLHAHFPRYGYHDLVTAQHLLVTQGLGVDHLRLVLGTSMGGMQTWLWGERFPGMMDALMPIASQPTQISGRNLLWRRLIATAIRQDPDWAGGEYRTPPTHWVATVPVFTAMTSSAPYLQAQGPTFKEAGALYDRIVAEALKAEDANNFLYWLESSWDYDPEPALGRIQARLVAVNFADDQVNPAELGVMEPLVAKVPGARYVLVPAGPGSMGHNNQTQAALWKGYLAELLDRTAPRKP
jgi:homoserine O-acetyltransferase